VLASRSMNGRMEARLLSEHPPMPGSLPVEPSLEDGYVAVMRSAERGQAVHHA
jgi:hypothetical protein